MSSRGPETLRQAQTWETTRNAYLGIGLCPECAAQAAWGHQLGFAYRAPRQWDESDSSIRPPCPRCKVIVASLPVSAGTTSPWRKLRSPVRPKDWFARPALSPALEAK